jgi:pimeloyl-ACP methyl ester carboxylesterase
VEAQRNSWLYLRDGRRLGFLGCGDTAGRPVFYCHGFPGSRLEVLLADRIAAQKGIRLIGVDRPGYGLSDDRPGRSLRDWADDVAELADRLGIERFSILGVSGGGPYAVACACRLRDRLLAVGIACGLAPITARGILRGMTGFNRFGLRLAAAAHPLVKPLFFPVAALLKHRPQRVLSSIAHRAGQPDRWVLNRPEVREIMCLSYREAMLGGLSGAVRDVVLYSRSWGLHLTEITVPVNLWHGEKDRIVSPAMGRWLAVNIPGCKARFYPEEGHFSLITNRMDAIIDFIRA